MPTKKKGGKKHHSKPSTSTPAPVQAPTPASAPAVASNRSVKRMFPPDILVLILKRLPVKSILRFKCVSKPWLALLSSPRFITMHRHQTSENPCNHAFLIRSIDEDYYNNMSLLNINSTPPNEPVSLVNPFPVFFKQMDFVGSVNGVVCLSCPPLGQMIVLWNPAMNLYKNISLPKSGRRKPVEDLEKISLGLSYDSMNDDYKIIRISCLNPKSASHSALLRVTAEVYSANLDSWKRVQIDFQFSVSATRSNVIAKGIPYWTGIIYQAGKFKEVLLYYDIPNGKFKNVPVPPFDGHEGTGVRFVEWKGNLGLIVSSPSKRRDKFIDILVYDELEAHWKKVSSHGPIGMKLERHMQCSKNGVILAETPDGRLVLYDPITNGIKVFCVPEAQKLSFEAFSYTESLVSFKKMEQVQEQDKDKYCFKPEDLGENAAGFMSILSFA